MNRFFAMLPDAAIEWHRRKIDALTRFPLSRKSDDDEDDWLTEFFSTFYNQRRKMSVHDGVATIHVHDYLGAKLPPIEKALGASDYGDIAAELQAARQDSAVKAVLMEINSGGGCASGCVEVGRMVSQLAIEKPTAIHTDGLCCSAAYAIGVGAEQRYASESALVGSVGTILSFVDFEQLLMRNGITPHVITNTGADLKAAGNDLRAPTPAELQHLQEITDEYASQFIDHVWSNNQKIDAEQGFRGQAVSGRQAKALGFIDGIASKEEVLDWLRVAAG